MGEAGFRMKPKGHPPKSSQGRLDTAPESRVAPCTGSEPESSVPWLPVKAREHVSPSLPLKQNCFQNRVGVGVGGKPESQSKVQEACSCLCRSLFPLISGLSLDSGWREPYGARAGVGCSVGTGGMGQHFRG